MYIPPPEASKFFVSKGEMGVYGPKAHQRVIAKLTAGLGFLHYTEHKLSLEPLPETMLNDGEASPVPDLILYDGNARITPVIVEICHTDGLRRDSRKVIQLVEETVSAKRLCTITSLCSGFATAKAMVA